MRCRLWWLKNQNGKKLARYNRFLISIFSLAVLTGCKSGRIGETADQDVLKGRTLKEQVFPDGPIENHTFLPASALVANSYYSATGKLTIDGNIPEGVTLQVNGKLVVNGNIGYRSKIYVEVPLVTHTKTTYAPGYCYEWGKFGFHFHCASTKRIIDGLKYNDPEPAVIITGKIASKATVGSHGGVMAAGKIAQPAINVYMPPAHNSPALKR